jgi:hypothetical protein
MITITGCVSKPKATHKIVLPPKPEREYVEPPKNISECAIVIDYYKTLVELWEAWGEDVEKSIGEYNE